MCRRNPLLLIIVLIIIGIAASPPVSGGAPPFESNDGSSQSEKLYDGSGRLRYKPGELLVKFRQGTGKREIALLHKSLGGRIIGRAGRLRIERIGLPEGMTEEEAISLYSASAMVESVERHALRYPQETPNDPLFAEQWNMTKINAPGAWDITTGSGDIIIAVIDTGVDYLHPDLAPNIWINPGEDIDGNGIITDADRNGEDDDGNGYDDDFYGWDFAGDTDDGGDGDADPLDRDGHGTHVAGIIAAKGNNALGIAGVAWNVRIMVLKVQADDGYYFADADILDALEYARVKGARIVNCSFGGSSSSANEEYRLRKLRDADILAVCAAGNDGHDTDFTAEYPACYDLPNIISVAASEENDSLWYKSNYGFTTVDLMAPGADILSTVPVNNYTDASVTVQGNPGAVEGLVYGMEYAGTTGEEGITGTLHNCGKGYPEDFPTEVSGNIALIERGKANTISPDFTFYEKTINAEEAGATAVIIYNDIFTYYDDWTLGSPRGWVPVVCMSNADGENLKDLGNPTVTVVNTLIENPAAYGTKAGTSMSTPHVSGAAGLILSASPGLDYSEVKATLINTVDRIAGMEGKMVSGGRLNVLSAFCLPGDLSSDSMIGLDDAIIALRVVAGLSPAITTSCALSLIDVDGDGRIGLEGAIYILQTMAGMTR